jgi:hypothetical protein
MKLKFTLSLFLASSILFASCWTILRGKPKNKIPIEGMPSGAVVTVNGIEVGVTPMIYTPKKRKETLVVISKEGYETSKMKIETKASPAIIAATAGANTVGFAAMQAAWLPFGGISLLVDLKTGALNTITTDSIKYNLETSKEPVVSENEIAQSNGTESKSSAEVSVSSNSVTTNKTLKFKDILNPTVEIRTRTSQVLLMPKTAVKIILKNGREIKSCVKTINENSITVKKKNEEVNYSDISSIRVYNSRRWVPIVFFWTIGTPIGWGITAKTYQRGSADCNKEIITIRTIDYTTQRVYGKANCNL